MKASYNWLKDFVDFQLSSQDLAHTLTMAGFEVEAIEPVEDDTVFDIGITPNRPDCLSMRGIAREISTILEIPFKTIPSQEIEEEGQGPPVEILNKDLCPRYSSRVITGIKPGASPEWLSKRLESCGIRSMSNIVDVTNYVMLEMGQPMHAFDLDKIDQGKIIVKEAGSTITFVTLDNEERKISKDMLLIWDGKKPVAIAGVMGGLNSEVHEGTTNILLESAYFNPSSVRKTSRALNISTEASYRFERGVDREAADEAMNRAAQMILDLAGGRATAMTDAYPEPHKPRSIQVSVNSISSLIGIDLDEDTVGKTLNSLGCGTVNTDGVLTVVPPSYREDLIMSVDIAEEIARLYGYDKIPSTFPVMQMSAAPENKKQKVISRLKESLVHSGFSEAINYSFMNTDALDNLNIGAGDRRRDVVHVKNPLRIEDAAMRTTLVPALLNNIQTNHRRGEKAIRLFEISKVFLPSKEKLPEEILQLGAVLSKEQTARFWAEQHEGFYDLKGAFENVLSGLKIKNISFSHSGKDTEPYLHPGKSCAIYINGNKSGSLGSLHPAVAEAFDIRGDISLGTIDNIREIIESSAEKEYFNPLPKYPCSERDMAIVVDDTITVASVEDEIFNTETTLIESVNLFDIYKGKPIPQGKKSLAYSIRYRSSERTLKDGEVDELHAHVLGRLQKSLNAELRS